MALLADALGLAAAEQRASLLPRPNPRKALCHGDDMHRGPPRPLAPLLGREGVAGAVAEIPGAASRSSR